MPAYVVTYARICFAYFNSAYDICSHMLRICQRTKLITTIGDWPHRTGSRHICMENQRKINDLKVWGLGRQGRCLGVSSKHL